ncbi:MAG: hypothetical protein CVU81_02550, partial [Euryarchaeota archaeon HGW-Euryarchaeota-1]
SQQQNHTETTNTPNQTTENESALTDQQTAENKVGRGITGLFLAGERETAGGDNPNKITTALDLTKKLFFVGQSVKYNISNVLLSKNAIFLVLTPDKGIKQLDASKGEIVLEENATKEGNYSLFVFEKRGTHYKYEKIGRTNRYELRVVGATNLVDEKILARLSNFSVNESSVLFKFNENESLFSSLEVFDVADLSAPIKAEEIAKKEIAGSRFQRAFAIDPTGANFSSAKLTIKNATASKLYKCKEWNFANRTCGGNWTFLQDITPGEDYTHKVRQRPQLHRTKMWQSNAQPKPLLSC